MSRHPEIRASYAKTVIGTIKRTPPATSDKLFWAVGDRRRRAIRELGLLAWIPGDDFAELVEIVASTLGPTAARDFWRLSLSLSFERRLITPLRMGARAIHGDKPDALLRMTPQAWQLVSRNCGTCSVQATEGDQVVLRFSMLPRRFTSEAMRLLWEGGSETCIADSGLSGRARSVCSGPGEVTMTVQWAQDAAGLTP